MLMRLLLNEYIGGNGPSKYIGTTMKIHMETRKKKRESILTMFGQALKALGKRFTASFP